MPVPNWQKWKHAYEVELREAIALSLNLTPGAFYDGEEYREYRDRLFIARRNLPRIGVIRAVGYEAPVVWVALPYFAAWAQPLGWQLPIELVETIDAQASPRLAPEAPETRPTPLPVTSEAIGGPPYGPECEKKPSQQPADTPSPAGSITCPPTGAGRPQNAVSALKAR
jgi:hypothetical protein